MIRPFHAGPLVAAGLFLVLLAGPVAAECPCASGGGSCDGGACGCKREGPCPPPFKYYYEGKPCIIFKKGCPRPICDPCHLEHFGYYQTCWQPWPYPPDWSHCATPPPGAVLPPPAVPPFSPKLPAASGSGTDSSSESPPLPSPRKTTPDQPPPGKLSGGPAVMFIH